MTTTLTDYHAVFVQQQQHQYAVARTTARERIKKLDRLHAAVLRHTDAIRAALWKDFRKGVTETDITEIGIVNTEIRHTQRHLHSWMQPKRVGTPIALFGSVSEIRQEPKGVSLVISPWNYPVQLALMPVISAIAAGNCVIIKPSEFTPHSSGVLKMIVEDCFLPEEVTVIEGDATVAQELLQLPFDHIFFTGSPAVGRIIMREAAKNLTSVTLELGGKSPVIVDETADLDNAANKIAWIKSMNAGQICIAPDYVLVHENVHDALVQKIGEKWQKFHGKTPEMRKTTNDFCRIVNDRHFDRMLNLLEDSIGKGATVAFGARHDRAERYIEPTILTGVTADMHIMEEEIFGPVLPVVKIKNVEEAITIVNKKSKALAMYLFSKNNKNIEYLLNETRNGNVTINDCDAHFFNNNLPFGGVGESGMGKCHGEFGFKEFTHPRGILRQTRFMPSTDFFLPPYGGKLAGWMLEGVKRMF